MLNESMALRNYAYLGDAVWEIFVREYVILKTSSSKMLHKLTTDRVNAVAQKELLEFITPDLTEDEAELVRRARNLSIPVARRSIQHDYRLSTAFETLVGYWFLHDKSRLEFFYDKFKHLELFS